MSPLARATAGDLTAREHAYLRIVFAAEGTCERINKNN